jgi:glycosyltransferase involved in cell wall biosynthesis
MSGVGRYPRRVVVGISLLTLVPGVVGGSETYARELCRALARVGGEDYRVFVPTIAEDAADGLPARTISAYRAGRTMPARVRAMTLAAARPRPVLRELEAGTLDALHFPLSVMLPPVERPPAVSSVLDVQHEVFPQFFSRAERTYRRVVYGWTVRRSRLVITISQHAADTLVERLGVAPDRVRPIHLGIDHERFRPGDEPREDFLLYPALGWPHKNHARLFEAFALLRRDRPGLRLVLTGYDGAAPEGVEARGRVPQDELARLYRRAAAVVFPSLYEGFGQPPLEAMASGCPVACSTGGSLPEVVGNGARLFDPTSVEDMAAATEEVLDDPAPWVERGLARAATFTWDECARRHDAVYRELLT